MSDEKGSRRHRLFKNGIYSVVSWIFPLLLALTVTPIVVKGLGHELYGLYAVILGFISYSFTFGIGKTAAKFVAEFRANGEHEKVSETVSSIFWLSLAFALGGTLIIGLLARPVVVNVLLIQPDLQDEAVTALYLACVVIIVTMLSQVFQFVLQGLQRFDRFLLLGNLSALLLNAGSAAIVIYGYGVSTLLLWNIAVTSAVGLLFYLTTRKLVPDLTISFRITAGVWRPVIKYATSIIFYQVFGNLLFLFERGWIVRRFGAEALTFYVVPMMLGIYLHLFIASLVLALFPVVNELLSDREALVRVYKTSTKVILTFVAFFVVTFIVCGGVFLSLWMSPEFAAVSQRVLTIHLLTFGALSMMMVTWQITESFRAAGLNALVTFLWMVIAVPLMVALSDGWEIYGVAFARFAGVLVFLPLIYYAERRFLGGYLWRFWFSTLTRVVIAVSLAGAAEWAILSQFTASWPAFILAGSLGFAVYCLALFASGFLSTEERAALRGLALRFR